MAWADLEGYEQREDFKEKNNSSPWLQGDGVAIIIYTEAQKDVTQPKARGTSSRRILTPRRRKEGNNISSEGRGERTRDSLTWSPTLRQRKRAPTNERGGEARTHWLPHLPVRGTQGTKGRSRGWTPIWPGQLEGVAGAGLSGSESRAGGETRWRLREGVLASQLPRSPAFSFPAAALAPGESFRTAPALLGKPPASPASSRAVPGPRRPRCPRPRSVRPRCRPHYLSRLPGPTVRGPWARAGRPPSRSARPGKRSAVFSRACLRGLRRAPSRPALGPRPGRRRRSRGRRGNGAAAAAAAATEPGRGEGGISPQAGSAPPASPRHLHPFPRSLPDSAGSPAEQERERERGGNGKKIPPPVPGAAAAGAVRRGARRRRRRRHGAPSPARPHGGGAGAAGTPSRDRVCARRDPCAPRPCPPRGEPDKRAVDVRV
nr:translation initiation factor IF-2-like [Gorilla gorilla gorilla]